MPEVVRIVVDGNIIEVRQGTSVAVAVLNAGILGMRASVSRDPRGPLCGVGICFECRVTIDGERHQRSCIVPCRDGMEVETDRA